MPRLSPQEAAEAIRPDVNPDVGASIPAERQRAIQFVKDTASALGLEGTNPAVFDHILQLLKSHDIDPSYADEYPKMLTVDGQPVIGADNEPVIFHSAAEEDAYPKANKPQPKKRSKKDEE